jgi:hypothetical protein
VKPVRFFNNLKDSKMDSIFKACKAIWMDAYREYTGADYYFGGKDAGSLAGLIRKIEHAGAEADLVVATFGSLVTHLPKWYRENAYSLSVVNGKYNEIVAEIRKKGHGKENGISQDYIRRQLDALGGQDGTHIDG